MVETDQFGLIAAGCETILSESDNTHRGLHFIQ